MSNIIINYQKELDALIEKNVSDGKVPSLLLHSCCAPCSSYVLEYLSQYFNITVYYYNPNIFPEEEYFRRINEQKEFIRSLNTKYPVNFIEGDYDSERFYEVVKGYENEREGSERCFRCYELRLNNAALIAKKLNFDYFTTTLSISPHKNAQKLNEIGEEVASNHFVKYLISDFKKKNGYKRSIELSKEYGLYRQEYCGCVFSKKQKSE